MKQEQQEQEKERKRKKFYENKWFMDKKISGLYIFVVVVVFSSFFMKKNYIIYPDMDI